MSEGLDLDHLRGWIGRTESAEDVVTIRMVREMRATLDHDPGAPQAGDDAPLASHWCLCPPTVPLHALGPDGHPARGGFLPPVLLPRRMWAGGTLDFQDTLKVGDTVRRTSRIDDVAVKEGRTGTLCFVTVRHRYETARGLAVAERQDIVYRGAGAAADSPAEPEPAPAFSQPVETSPVLLFRYSAITFNGHRIHYDRAYCTQVEGYPGLVVHAPLQATLLVAFAAECLGRRPARFRFRAVRPLFDGPPVTLNALPKDDGLLLWTADHQGRASMRAECR